MREFEIDKLIDNDDLRCIDFDLSLELSHGVNSKRRDIDGL